MTNVMFVFVTLLVLATCAGVHSFDGVATNEIVECRGDMDCPEERTCRNHKCEDPCVSLCGKNHTVCRVKNHYPSCACSPGFSGDPFLSCNQLGTSSQSSFGSSANETLLLSPDVYKSKNDAVKHCASLGMRLATILSAEKQSQVQEYLSKFGTDWNRSTKVWTSGVYTTSGVSWPNSSNLSPPAPVPFTFWEYGAVMSDLSGFNCVVLNEGNRSFLLWLKRRQKEFKRTLPETQWEYRKTPETARKYRIIPEVSNGKPLRCLSS